MYTSSKVARGRADFLFLPYTYAHMLSIFSEGAPARFFREGGRGVGGEDSLAFWFAAGRELRGNWSTSEGRFFFFLYKARFWIWRPNKAGLLAYFIKIVEMERIYIRIDEFFCFFNYIILYKLL